MTHTLAASDAGANAGAVVLIIFLIALYWAPTFVGIARRDRVNLGAVIACNFFGFFAITWIAAWVFACSTPRPVQMMYQGAPPPRGREPQYPPDGSLPPGYH